MTDDEKKDYAAQLAQELAMRDARDAEIRAALRAEFEKDLNKGELTNDDIRAKFVPLFETAVTTLMELMNSDNKEATRLQASRYVVDVLTANTGDADPSAAIKKLVESMK